MGRTLERVALQNTSRNSTRERMLAEVGCKVAGLEEPAIVTAGAHEDHIDGGSCTTANFGRLYGAGAHSIALKHVLRRQLHLRFVRLSTTHLAVTIGSKAECPEPLCPEAEQMVQHLGALHVAWYCQKHRYSHIDLSSSFLIFNSS